MLCEFSADAINFLNPEERPSRKDCKKALGAPTGHELTTFQAEAKVLLYGDPEHPDALPKVEAPKTVPKFPGLDLNWASTGNDKKKTYLATGKSRYGNVMVYARKGLLMIFFSNPPQTSYKYGSVLDSQAFVTLWVKHGLQNVKLVKEDANFSDVKKEGLVAYPNASIQIDFSKSKDPAREIRETLEVLFENNPQAYSYPPSDIP